MSNKTTNTKKSNKKKNVQSSQQKQGRQNSKAKRSYADKAQSPAPAGWSNNDRLISFSNPQYSKQSVAQLNKQVSQRLHPRLGNFFRAISDPFNSPPCKAPVTYNPVPSTQSAVFRMTSTSNNIVVAAGSTMQYTLFPGHLPQYGDQVVFNPAVADTEIITLDSVSYHTCFMPVAGGGPPWSVGPFANIDATGTTGPACVFYKGMALNTCDFGVAALSVISYDTAAPLAAENHFRGAQGGHLRWRLNAMGVRIVNTTPLAKRGGSVVTVQPNNENWSAINYTQQHNLQVFPSYMDHGTIEDSATISWIPRPQDLAYYHTEGPTIIGTPRDLAETLDGCAMVVFMNNNTGEAISYKLEVVFHFEMAGIGCQMISSASVNLPNDKNLVEPVLTHTMASGSFGSAGMQKLATELAPTANSFLDVAAKKGLAMLSAGAKSAATNALGF